MSLFETTYYYDIVGIEDDWAGLLCSEEGLLRCTLLFKSQKAAKETLLRDWVIDSETSLVNSPEVCAPYAQALEKYFIKGDDTEMMSLAIDWSEAPPFFRTVWEVCREIPSGETRSYQWLASQAGSPKAVRAAGQAMAKNPTPLFVPCHRVLRNDGDLGGYGYGPDWKRRLLEHEQEYI